MPRFDWKMSAALSGYRISGSPGIRTGLETSISSAIKGGCNRFSRTIRHCSAANSVHSTHIRATTCSKPPGSFFVGRTEVAGVLSHISRHLGDRPKAHRRGRELTRTAHHGASATTRTRSMCASTSARSSKRRSTTTRGSTSWIWRPVTGCHRGTLQFGSLRRARFRRPGARAAARSAAGKVRPASRCRWQRSHGVLRRRRADIDADPLDCQPRRWAHIGLQTPRASPGSGTRASGALAAPFARARLDSQSTASVRRFRTARPPEHGVELRDGRSPLRAVLVSSLLTLAVLRPGRGSSSCQARHSTPPTG